MVTMEVFLALLLAMAMSLVVVGVLTANNLSMKIL
jgi:hypothetical protein